MDKDAIKKFALDFSPYESTLRKFANSKIKLLDDKTIAQIDINKLIERAKKKPKLHIWIGAYSLLTSIVDMEGYSDYLKYEKANKFLYESDED